MGGGLAGTGSLIEYVDESNHYFMTLEGAESQAVDRGAFGVWKRTGQTLRVYVDVRGRPVEVESACRFYGTPGVGPRSHFYSLDSGDNTVCEGIRTFSWNLETASAFAAARPGLSYTNPYRYDPYACKTGHPVYRLYNSRFGQNDSGHRYVSDPELYKAMQATGWVGENVRFCEAG